MGEVRFTSSMDVRLIQVMGSDLSVVAAARVSTLGDVSLLELETGEHTGLIRYLMRNRHGTPFEHNAMTFYMRAPIFVYREFHRHRIGFSYNEESGRYKQLEPEFYVPSLERELSQEGKTGDYNMVQTGIENPELYDWLVDRMKVDCINAYAGYEERLANGISKEVARMTLPVNIMSSQYVTCNLRSLMAFLSLRTRREDAMFPSKPMKEINMVADIMEAFFKEHFPIVWQAFEDGRRVAP